MTKPSTFLFVGRPKKLPKLDAMKSWVAMMQRCYNPRAARYENYGGRGIKVCDQWHIFAVFFADMGERPPGLSLERKDPHWHYCPENCRWATQREQSRNTTKTLRVTIKGETRTLLEWSEASGLSYYTLHKRIRLKWPHDELLLPIGATIGVKKRGVAHSPEHVANLRAALLRHHREKRGVACK